MIYIFIHPETVSLILITDTIQCTSSLCFWLNLLQPAEGFGGTIKLEGSILNHRHYHLVAWDKGFFRNQRLGSLLSIKYYGLQLPESLMLNILAEPSGGLKCKTSGKLMVPPP